MTRVRGVLPPSWQRACSSPAVAPEAALRVTRVGTPAHCLPILASRPEPALRRVDQRHAARHGHRSPPDRRRVRPGQHRRRSGAAERHLRRRQQRRAVEVVGLRQHLGPHQRHAPRRPARQRHRGGGNDAATIWAAGYNTIFKSVDGGPTFIETQLDVSLIRSTSIPTTHAPDQRASRGRRHRRIHRRGRELAGGPRAGFPSGGVSWYPFFIDTGTAASTRRTWFAIAQNGASAIMTSDRARPGPSRQRIAGLQHPHGNSQIFQSGSTLFAAGLERPAGPRRLPQRRPGRDLVPRRQRAAARSRRVGDVEERLRDVRLGLLQLRSRDALRDRAEPGTDWAPVDVPVELEIGPNGVVSTSDGTHNIFVGLMWDQGLWRYVEP